jgi:serine/threonine protein kinase
MVSYKDLRACTANFSKQFNKLGAGANSTVYMGVLYGLKVAVKQFESSPEQTEEELEWEDEQFEREVEFLSKMRHPNICR